MGFFLTTLGGVLAHYGVLLVAGIAAFVLWGILKAAGRRAGERFGWGALGAALIVCGVGSIAYLSLPAFGAFLLFVGVVVLLLAALAKRPRKG